MLRQRVVVLVSLLLSLVAMPGRAQTASPQAAAPQAGGVQEGEDLVILLDRSGSMLGQSSDKRGLATALVLYLMDQARLAGETSRVAVVTFGNEVKVIPEGGLTPVGPELIEAVAQIPRPRNRERTSMERALRKALELLGSDGSGRKRRVVLVSDGVPEPPLDAYPQLLAEAEEAIQGVSDPSKRDQLLAPFLEKASKTSLEQIQGALLPQFAAEGIPVIPVILGESEETAGLLRQVAAATTGDAEQAVQVKESMIAALAKTVRRPPGVMPVDRADSPGGAAVFERDIHLPPECSLVEFLLHYPPRARRGAWKDLEVTLTDPQGGVYHRQDPGYRAAFDRNNDPKAGTMVFERLVVANPSPGVWHLTVRGKGGRILPPLALYVDARTALRLRLTVQPEVQEGAGEVLITAQVAGADGSAVPFHAAEGEVGLPDGSKAKLAFSAPGAGDTARATFDAAGEPPFGGHRVWVTARLGPGGMPYLQGEASFETQPALAANIWMTIPAGGNGGTADHGPSGRDDSLYFPVLGDTLGKYTIGPIKVETDSKRPISIRLALSPLKQEEGQVESPSRWLQLRPSAGSVVAGRPFVFHLTAALPEYLPADLAQEKMQGRLIVTSDMARTDLATDVVVRVQFPEVKIVGKVARSRLLTVRFPFLVPGYRLTELEVTSTAAVSHPGVVKIYAPEPLSQAQPWLQPGQLTLTVPGDQGNLVELPPAGEVVHLPIRVATGRGVPRGLYGGKIIVAGSRILPATVRYRIVVPRVTWGERIAPWLVPGSIVASGAALLLGLAAWCAGRWRRGREVRLTPEQVAGSGWHFRDLFGIRCTLDDRGRASRWELEDPHPDLTVGDRRPQPGAVLHRNQEIQIHRYTFRVRDPGRRGLTLEVEESPHRPARWRRLALLGAVAAAVFLALHLRPQLLLQLLQR